MWGTFHTTGIFVSLYIHTPPVLSLVFLHVWLCKYVGGDGGNRQVQEMSGSLEYNNPHIVWLHYQCLDCYIQWCVHSNLVPYFVVDVIPISFSFIYYTYYHEALCILDKACSHFLCVYISVQGHYNGPRK